MNTLDKLLTTLAEAPPGQIDARIVMRFMGLVGCSKEIIAYNLKEIRDECVAGNMATPFALRIINETIVIAETK